MTGTTHIRASMRARGYTIIELLVVVGIAALVIAAAVPALNSITASARRAAAENALRVGLRTARAAAIESGVDAGAVFFHEPGGRLTIIPCTLAGEFLDTSGNDPRLRQVFAPAQNFEPVQLPTGWFIRAFVPEGVLDSGDNEGWYEEQLNIYDPDEPNWIFPETAYYDLDMGDDGEDRQTYMVRFHGGSGELNLADIAPVLIFAPDARATFRRSGIWRDHPADADINAHRFVKRVLGLPVSELSRDDRDELLGDLSSDTVLTRAVGQLALYQETALAGGLRARGVNDESGTLYLAEDSSGNPVDRPQIDQSLFTSGLSGASGTVIAQWLESRMPSSDARLFTISRYRGATVELEPLEPETGAN